MNDYKVYFELYGKKMVKNVKALSQEMAKMKVKEDIIFHKVVGERSEWDDAMDFLDKITKK